MQKKSEDFSVQEAMRLAKTPAGQQLIALLQQEKGDKLQDIIRLAQAGNMQAAGNALQTILSSGSAQKLMKEMEEQKNG